MIRFVDLSPWYWTDEGDSAPCCAFLDTVTDRFVEVDGSHVMHGAEDVAGLGERFAALVPEGFWKRETKG